MNIYLFVMFIGKIVYHNDSMRYPPGYYEQQYNFDFFNYAGIHRPVILYTVISTRARPIFYIRRQFSLSYAFCFGALEI